MKLNRAQTATEYIVLLAVVMLIALIVVGFLGGIPDISGAARMRTSSAYWQSADVALTGFSMKTTSSGLEHSIVLRNNFPHTITLINLNASVLAGSYVTFSSDDIVLRAGQSATITNSSAFVVCEELGDPFSVSLRIEYIDDETGGRYLFGGSGNRIEGTCSQ